jgi:starch phosphorylase
MTETPVVAYFSMEIGLESTMPTYAGGLGILAGDTRGTSINAWTRMVWQYVHNAYRSRLEHGTASAR